MAKDLTRGSPTKLLIRFALPLMLASIFQQLYNVADSVIVGRAVGETALAAVGSTGSISGLVLMLMMGASTGMSVVAAQFYGAGDEQTLKKTVVTASVLVAGLAIVLSAVGVVFAEPLLRVTKVPENVLPDAVTYMRITMLGAIATGFYNVSSSLLRSLGDSLTPLVILVLSSLLNVGLNLLFVVVFRMAVAGVAIATVLATAVSAVVCIVYMWVRMPALRFGRAHLRPDPAIVKMVVKIGIPSALLSSTVSIGMLMIQVIVNTYGQTVMAAYSVALKLESLAGFPAGSVGQAMQVYAGQNMGIGDETRVKKGFRSGAIIVLSYCFAGTAVLLLFGKPLLGIFTTEGSGVIDVGYEYLSRIAYGLPVLGLLFLSRSTLLGAGDAMVPFIMGVFEMLSRLAASLLLAIPLGYIGVFWGTPLAWATACLFGLLRYRSGKWKEKRLVKDAPKEQTAED